MINVSLCTFIICRVTSVQWKGVTHHQNAMRRSTVHPSLVVSNHRSSSSRSSKEAPLHPLQDSRSHTASTAAVGLTLVVIAVHPAPAISFHFPLVVNGCREQQGPIHNLTSPLRWCSQPLRVLKGACGRDPEIWTIRTTPADRVALGVHPRDPVTLPWIGQRRWCHQNNAWITMASGGVRWALGSLPMVQLGLAHLCLAQYRPTTSPLRGYRTTFHRCPAQRPCPGP